MKYQKKQISTKKFIWYMAIALTVTAAIFWLITIINRPEPSWSYAQVFKNGDLITSVETGRKRGKTSSSERHFFRIFSFDFRTKKAGEIFEVPIENQRFSGAECLGYTDKYIWLKTPELTAVDMTGKEPVILGLKEITKLIATKNKAFKSIYALYIGDHFLVVSNQDGDEYYVNPKDFSSQLKRPTEKELANGWQLILKNTPQTTQFVQDYATDWFSDGKNVYDYGIFPESSYSTLKNNILRRNYNPENPTSLEGGAVVEYTDGSAISVPNDYVGSPGAAIKPTAIGGRTFLNAKAIGLKDGQFIFMYQKENLFSSPWLLAWFDVNDQKIKKEIDLSLKGLKLEEQGMEITPYVSVDERYIYLTSQGKDPVRFPTKL